jgi:RHS repeat-associated protein
MILSQFIYLPLPEGYYSNGQYFAVIHDYLGSVRVVLRASDNRVMEVNHYDPWGVEYGLSENPFGIQPFKHQGKERLNITGFSLHNHGARLADNVMARWTTRDPLEEKDYWNSAYVYCGNNPIRWIDPDGRKWKNAVDEKIAKQLQKDIATQNKSLAKQKTKINANIEKINNNANLSADEKNKKIAKQQGKLDNVQAQEKILSNLNDGITKLGTSKTTYTFNTSEKGTTAKLSSNEDGTIVINNYGNTGSRAHETTHAIQYDNGNISFDKLGSDVINFHTDYRKLEIEAYSTEYAITGGRVPSSTARYPRTIFDLNNEWLYGIKDATGIYIYSPENYK